MHLYTIKTFAKMLIEKSNISIYCVCKLLQTLTLFDYFTLKCLAEIL